MMGKPGTVRSQLATGASGSFTLRLVHTGLGFVTSVILARILGAQGYGMYAYAISWITLLLVPGAIGLPLLLTREVAQSKATKDWPRLRGVVRWADRIALGMSIGIISVSVGVIWMVRSQLEPGTPAVLFLAMLLLPLLVLTRLREGTLRGLGNVVESQIPQMLVLPTLFLMLVVVAVLVPIPVTGLTGVAARIVAAFAALLVGMALVQRRLPRELRKAPRSDRSPTWLPSAVTLLLGTVAVTLNYEISVVMVGSIMGAAPAGVFSVATRSSMVVAFVSLAVCSPLAPIVARLHSTREWGRLQGIATRSARVMLIGSLPLGFGLILFGRWFLLLFGDEFTQGTTALAILCVGQLVSAGLGPAGTLLTMTGYERDAAIGVGIAGVLTTVCNIFFIPVWGIEGAAIATVLGLGAWKVMLALWTYRRLNINCTPLRRSPSVPR